MNQLPGPVRPFVVIQPLPRQKRRAWWPWGVLTVILALVAMIPVRTYYYRDWLEARYYTTPLIVWLIERCYIVDPYGK